MRFNVEQTIRRVSWASVNRRESSVVRRPLAMGTGKLKTLLFTPETVSLYWPAETTTRTTRKPKPDLGEYLGD